MPNLNAKGILIISFEDPIPSMQLFFYCQFRNLCMCDSYLIALCRDEMSNSLSYGDYSWPDGVSGGSTLEIQCYYANISTLYPNCYNLSAKVTGICNQLGFWEEPDYTNCPTVKYCQLIELSQVQLSSSLRRVTKVYVFAFTLASEKFNNFKISKTGALLSTMQYHYIVFMFAYYDVIWHVLCKLYGIQWNL